MFEIDTRKELETVYAELHRDARGEAGEADPEWSLEELQSAIRCLEASINTQLGLAENEALEEPEGAWACNDSERDERDAGHVTPHLEGEHDESVFGMTYDEMPGVGEDY